MSSRRNDIIYSFRPRKSGTFEYDKRDGDEISGFYFIYFCLYKYIYIYYIYVYNIYFLLFPSAHNNNKCVEYI